MHRLNVVLATLLTLCTAAAPALAADRIRVAVQRTGTLSWELDVIRAHGLDRKAGLEIQALELAGTEGGKIAMKGGAVDVMLSDWLWVARERSLGGSLVFYPSSSTLGAVMVPGASPIRGLADLKGKKLAVAGGPLDKSWLLLQALARRSGLDLKRDATIVYGAPPLLTQKVLQGEVDAALTYWNFAAELEAKGFRRAIAVDEVMRALGARAPIAIVGYTFESRFAEAGNGAIDRFLDITRQAKEILAADESEWQRLAPRIGARDPETLAVFRKRYAEGIVQRPVAEEEADARALFEVVAQVGGQELVGTARELSPGTFYRGGKVSR